MESHLPKASAESDKENGGGEMEVDREEGVRQVELQHGVLTSLGLAWPETRETQEQFLATMVRMRYIDDLNSNSSSGRPPWHSSGQHNKEKSTGNCQMCWIPPQGLALAPTPGQVTADMQRNLRQDCQDHQHTASDSQVCAIEDRDPAGAGPGHQAAGGVEEL